MAIKQQRSGSGFFGGVMLLLLLALQLQQSIWKGEIDIGARPYVSISSIGFTESTIKPGAQTIKWHIKNSIGGPPATIVKANMTIWFDTNQHPLPEMPHY